MSKRATPAEQRHMERVAKLPCATCERQKTRTEVHHIREGQGAAQRGGNFLTIPLCQGCHTGPVGVHGDKTMLRLTKGTELDLLDATLAKIYGRVK